MNYASAITGIILALMLLATTYADFTAQPKVLEVLDRLQVPRDRAKLLGTIKAIGALGLILGIWSAPIGIVASLGLSLYFVVAVAVHARADDTIVQMLPVTPFLVLSMFVLLTTLAR